MDWKEKDNQLIKEFELGSFSDIVNALPEIGTVADGMNHHPDFEVYGYKHIKFKLQTHSEGKVTQKDHNLAKEIDRILSNN
ncbi:MAG: 4a-hydroxytetrahydrobiopterin dehydratase [Crocinitomicaceae bacterium]|nr:4a-hydroxytetrahydrobiopterin dehydratase [Crocinitomicaceae bacterium]